MTDPDVLLDRLLINESDDPNRLTALQRQIRLIGEERITRPTRVILCIIAILMIATSARLEFVHFYRVSPAPVFTQMLHIVVGTFITVAVVFVGIAIGGAFRRRIHYPILFGISILMLLGMAAIMLNAGWELNDPHLIYAGNVMLWLSAIMVFFSWLERTQIQTRKKLLELEYRLAVISEQLRKR